MFFIALFVTLVATTSAQAAHEKVLHNFVAFPRGANPQDNLVADAAGNLYGTTYDGGTYGLGSVFELTPNSDGKWTEIVLHSFKGGSDGSNPTAGVIFDAAGNLYGTTTQVSTNGCLIDGCGTVFKLSPSKHSAWTENILHTFTGYPNDGQIPAAGLVLDATGNLYGTTEEGGFYGWGVVFELSPQAHGVWTEATLYNFSGGPDGGYPLAGLILDSAGSLYGTTAYGGDPTCNVEENDPSCGTVFELTPNGKGSWTETVLHTFILTDGAYPAASLVFDATGNLYGTTPQGPGVACYNSGCGTIFRLHPNSDGSWTHTMVYNFEGGPDGGNPVSGLVLGPDGRLYGTTQYGGDKTGCYSSGCGTAFELTPHSGGRWSERVIRRFGGAPPSVNGQQPVAGLLLDQQGNLYGTTESGGSLGGSCNTNEYYDGCGVVFKLTPTSGGLWEISNLYVFPPGSAGLSPKAGLTSDSSGNLYGTTVAGGKNDCSFVTGGRCGTVFQLQPKSSGHWKTILLHNFNGLDGAQPAASLIADGSGNLYGTTTQGGSSNCSQGCGVVFELLPALSCEWKEVILHTFKGSADGEYPSGGLLFDEAGNLYGTTGGGGNLSYCGGYGCGTVFKLTPVGGNKWKKELLYAFPGGNDGAGPDGTLIFDEQGALYGTTYSGGGGYGTVFRLSRGSSGKWTEQVLYSFLGYQNGDGSYPLAGLVADSDGNLFGTTAQGGSTAGYCGNGGCGVVFELSRVGAASWKETVILAFDGSDGSNPESTLIFDTAGNLYGAASANGSYDYTPGGVVFELSPGSYGWTEQVLHQFGTGTDGTGPNGPLVFDQAGNIYGTTSAGGTDGGGIGFEISRDSNRDWSSHLATPPIGRDSGHHPSIRMLTRDTRFPQFQPR